MGMNKQKYSVLMALLLSSIGIKCAGSGESNPFQQSTSSGWVLIFVIAAFSHFLTSTNSNNNSAAAADRVITLIFHLSGIVGCETLLWILVAPHLLSYCLTNMFVLPLLASIWASFFNSTAAPVASNENDEMPTATSTAEEQV